MLEFGGGSISDYDWNGMEEVIDKYNLKSVIEFGVGVSTKLFVEKGLTVLSFEHAQKWIDIVKEEVDVEIIKWDCRNFPVIYLDRRFDLAFVDGKDPRDEQVLIARVVSDYILLHDGARPTEKEYVRKYLSDWIEEPVKGRCNFFKRI